MIARVLVTVDPEAAWTLVAFVVGLAAGVTLDRWLARAHQSEEVEEVELFTVNGAAAYPVGKVLDLETELGHVPADRARYWKVTRHEELGQVRPLGGEPRWPVRVWGRPA